MAITRIATTSINLVAQALIDAIDASGQGKIKVYTGPMPDTPQTALTTQVLLGTLRTGTPCGVVSSNRIMFNPIAQDDMADNDGIAAWARITAGNDTVVMDIDITDRNGTGALRLNAINVVATGPIRVNSMTLYIGA